MSQEDYTPNSVNLEQDSLEQLLASSPPSGFGCPECGGPLWQTNIDQRVKRYQCHVGHAFVGESLLKSQGEEIERHLWAALRLLREQAVLARQVASQARSQNRPEAEIEEFEAQAELAMHQAEAVHQVLQNHEVRTVMEPHSTMPRNEMPRE